MVRRITLLMPCGLGVTFMDEDLYGGEFIYYSCEKCGHTHVFFRDDILDMVDKHEGIGDDGEG